MKFVNVYDVFRDEVEKYRVVAKKYPLTKIVGKTALANIEKIEKKAKKKLSLQKQDLSTHNDFIFENLLLGNDGKIYLLDFEYGGLILEMACIMILALFWE